MILSRNHIKERWESGDIRFEPNINEEQIQICSINLRVGNNFNKTKKNPGHIINPSLAISEGLYEAVVPAQGKVFLEPIPNYSKIGKILFTIKIYVIEWTACCVLFVLI